MENQNLKHQTKKGLYWTTFNQLTTYGMQFVVGIVMARMLSPEDYGITALPSVFISIASIFIECGFANAMIRKPELTAADLTTSFYYSFAVGIVCYVSLFFSAPIIANFYEVPVLKPLVRITAITFLFTPLSTPQRVILNRQLDFKTPTQISIATRLASGFLGIVMAYMGLGLWSLVVSNLCIRIYHLKRLISTKI